MAPVGGFLLSALPILNLLHVGQYLLPHHAVIPHHEQGVGGGGATTAPPTPTPRLVRGGLEVYAPPGHLLVAEDAGGSFMIASGASPVLTATLPLLLQDFLDQGPTPSFVEALAPHQGWSLVAVDLTSQRLVVATDSLGTHPIFLAASDKLQGERAEEEEGGDGDGSPPPAATGAFALSSSPSALYRLGFETIQAVNSSMVMVLEIPSLAVISTTDLAHLLPKTGPPALVPGAKAATTAGEAAATTTSFDRMIKRSLGMMLRQPQWAAATEDRPPLCVVIFGRQPREDDLLVRTLHSLPSFTFLVYHIMDGGKTVERVKYVKAQPVLSEALPLQPREALDRLEPHVKDLAVPALLLALSTICSDAQASGVPLYISGANLFHSEDATVPAAVYSRGLTAFLRVEGYVTQAYGLTAHHPLLAHEVEQAFLSLSKDNRRAIKASTGQIPKPPTKFVVSRVSGKPIDEGMVAAITQELEKPSPQLVHIPEGTKLGSESLDQLLAPFKQKWGQGDHEGARATLIELLEAPFVGSLFSGPLQARLSVELGRAYHTDRMVVKAIDWYCKAVAQDRSYARAYQEFADLGAGNGVIFEASVAMNQEVVRILRSKLATPLGEDPVFREIALYNLGQALYYSKADEREMEEVYRQIIHVAKRAKQAPRVPSPSGQPGGGSVMIMTVASKRTQQLENLVESAQVAGVDIVVLGEGVEYMGHASKMRLYWEMTTRDDIDDDQLLMAVDAYDVILSSAVRRLPDIFLREFQRPIVLGGERTCWPDPAISVLYKREGLLEHDLPFLNSGTFVGRKRHLRQMLSEVLAYSAQFDDQRMLTRFYFEHPEMVEVDHFSKIFYTLHDTAAPLIIDATGEVHVPGVGLPLALHANAGDGKLFYSVMVPVWREALREGKTTLSSNYGYYRGFHHQRRAEHLLAVVCFLWHLLTYRDFHGEATYHTAKSLQALGQHDLARVFYLRSLTLTPHTEVQSAATHLADMEDGLGLLSTAYQVLTHMRRLDGDQDDPALLAFQRLTDGEVDDDEDDVRAQAMKTAYQQYAESSSKPPPSPSFHEFMEGEMGSHVTAFLNTDNHLSGAFRQSPYFTAGLVLCQATHHLQSSVASADFNLDRVFRVLHHMEKGQINLFCEEFRGAFPTGKSAAAASA